MRQSLRIAVRVMLMGSAGMIASQVKAQLKVGKNPTKIEKSAILELESDKQGLLLPRVADTSLMTSLNPPDGMIIYWTQTGKQGFYVRHNYEWEKMSTKSSSWDLLGNYVADAATQFIGSTNPIPFVMKGNNVEGIRIDNGNVTLSNNVTLSGITAGGGVDEQGDEVAGHECGRRRVRSRRRRCRRARRRRRARSRRRSARGCGRGWRPGPG